MCHVEYGETCTVWNEQEVKARKRHRCTLCQLPILPGTVYTRIGSLFDGSWDTNRVHQDCYALTRYIQLEVCNQDAVFVEPGLRAEVAEHIHESPEVLRRWRRIFRRQLREREAA